MTDSIDEAKGGLKPKPTQPAMPKTSSGAKGINLSKKADKFVPKNKVSEDIVKDFLQKQAIKHANLAKELARESEVRDDVVAKKLKELRENPKLSAEKVLQDMRGIQEKKERNTQLAKKLLSVFSPVDNEGKVKKNEVSQIKSNILEK